MLKNIIKIQMVKQEEAFYANLQKLCLQEEFYLIVQTHFSCSWVKEKRKTLKTFYLFFLRSLLFAAAMLGSRRRNFFRCKLCYSAVESALDL